MTRVALALAVLVPLVGASPARAAGPFHGRDAGGSLTVSGLPEVLSRPEVRRHLTTGLTTGLHVGLEARAAGGQSVRGAARVDVRWEPWDEVFFVTTIDGIGRVRREQIDSFERLVAWWTALELTVASAGPVTREALTEARVELRVIPFSLSEQRDAQRWFSGALAPETVGDKQVGPGESRLNGVVDLLIATSIQRRSIVRYPWPAQARAAASPEPR